MLISRFFTGLASMGVVLGSMVFVAPALAGDDSDALARAITLFEQGEYLAAQEALTSLDRSKLAAADQARRDEYLNRIQVAITMEDKALRDLEDAETASEDGALDRARELLQTVLANEYTPKDIRTVAQSRLRELNRSAGSGGAEPQRAEPSHEPQGHKKSPQGAGGTAEAKRQTTRGDTLVRSGQYDAAEQAYESALMAVPGYPEAVAGIQRIRQFRERNLGAAATSLADEMKREAAINWQRTVTQYRDAERIILQDVAAEWFDDARQVLIRARQIVESGRQFAEPLVKYENLRSEVVALEQHVSAAERTYNERKVAEVRQSIEKQRSRKLREIEERRARQVDQLMAQAVQHRKDGEYVKAMNVLRQVSVVDSKYMPARWMLDQIEDEYTYRRQRKMRDKFYDQSLGALLDVEEAKIPWWEDINYPDDWIERTSRPLRAKPGETNRNSLLLGALDQPIDVDFRGDPLRQVVEYLADAHQVNIIVNWHDLETAGVQADVPIDLHLPNQISMRKALTEILSQAGAGTADLGFDIADGAVTVATQRTLDSKTYPAVYPISDLLMDIPTYNGAPAPDLRNVQPAVASPAQEPNRLDWQHGDDDNDEPEEDPAVRDKISQLIELIRDTVAPDSWRERGGSIGSIREINQQLVVTQNSAAQRQIGGLLDKLREQRAIQISVEAIFLTVSSHYLEELGMDLDVVLNGGNAGFDFVDEGGGSVATDPVLGNRLLLPRTFSQLGFTPATPVGLGAPLTAGPAINQPFGQTAFIPPRTNSGGRRGTPVPILSSVTDFTNPANLPSDIPGSFAGQTIGPALSIMGSFLDNIQVDFMLRATQADSRTTVLTAPRLVVFNGGSAWVAVTIQQNFVSQLNPVVAQGAVAQAPVTQVIDAGASLFVRGTVTIDRRYVMLLLAPGITRLLDLQTFAFSGGTGALAAFVQLPTLSAQRIQTMVSVPDGGTLLIGGQKLASETEVEAGVPILSKIPILKRAYSSRSTVKDEQTLLILIKPKILIHSEQEELAFPGFSKG